MKPKLLLLLAFAGAATTSVSAQEPTDAANDGLLVSGQGVNNQDLPLTAPGPDGGTYISWLSWEDQSASLKMQLLDKNGEPVWNEGGKYISTYLTPTWSSGYDLTSDSEGNALVVYCDQRNGYWQAYAYKIDPEGNSLWGDGVLMTTEARETCLNPKLIVTDAGNVVVGYYSEGGSSRTLRVSKLRSDGTKAWGGYIAVAGTLGLYNLVSSTGDSFYVSYILGNTAEVAVMRYTANGEPAWGEPVMVDTGSAVVSTEPVAASDDDGGILVAWRYSVKNTEVRGALQGVDRDGNLLWPVFEEYPNVPRPAAYKGIKYAAFTEGRDNADNLFISRYNADGSYGWDTLPLINGDSYRITIYGVVVVDGEPVVAYRRAEDYNKATIGAAHVDENGQIVDQEIAVCTSAGDKGTGGLCYNGGEDFTMAWTDNQGHIYAAQFEISQISSAADVSLGATAAAATYSDGMIQLEGFSGTVSVCNPEGKLLLQAEPRGGAVAAGSLAKGIYFVSDGVNTAKLYVK